MASLVATSDVYSSAITRHHEPLVILQTHQCDLFHVKKDLPTRDSVPVYLLKCGVTGNLR